MSKNTNEGEKPATGGLSLASSGFKMDTVLTGAKEFIPTGFVVKTAEQFPDLDDLDEAKHKKKKGKKGKN